MKKKLPKAVKGGLIALGTLALLFVIFVVYCVLTYDEPVNPADIIPDIAGVQKDTAQNQVIYTTPQGTTLTVQATDETEISNLPAEDKITEGQTKDGATYTAVANADSSQTVYVKKGSKTVKATVPASSGKKDSKNSKAKSTDAATAAAVVSALITEQGYTQGEYDYSTRAAVRYIDVAGCVVFYPELFTKITEYEDTTVCMLDPRCSATLTIEIEENEYESVAEFCSLAMNTDNNQLLGIGDDCYTAETYGEGDVIFTFCGFGKPYNVRVTLTYPTEYKWVFSEVRDLIHCVFDEANRMPKKESSKKYTVPDVPKIEYSESEVSYFYLPSYKATVMLPATFLPEEEFEDSTLYFTDAESGTECMVQFYERTDEDPDNLMDTFMLTQSDVREGTKIWMEEEYIRWLNEENLCVGAVGSHWVGAMALSDEGIKDTYGEHASQFGVWFADEEKAESVVETVQEAVEQYRAEEAEKKEKEAETTQAETAKNGKKKSTENSNDKKKQGETPTVYDLESTPVQELANVTSYETYLFGQYNVLYFYPLSDSQFDRMYDIMDDLEELDFTCLYNDTEKYGDGEQYFIFVYQGYLPTVDSTLTMQFEYTLASADGDSATLTYCFDADIGTVEDGGLLWKAEDGISVEDLNDWARETTVRAGFEKLKNYIAQSGNDPDKFVYQLEPMYAVLYSDAFDEGEIEIVDQSSEDFEDAVRLPCFSFGVYKNGKYVSSSYFIYELVNDTLYMYKNGECFMLVE